MVLLLQHTGSSDTSVSRFTDTLIQIESKRRISDEDRREFGGRFSVKENSQRLANYRYLDVQLMEMLGG